MATLASGQRSQMVADVLPLFASYLKDRNRGISSMQGVAGALPPEWEAFAATLELVHLLGTFEALRPQLAQVMARIAREREFATVEHQGYLRGHLDVAAWLRTYGVPHAPRRYPGRVLVERYDLPENVLIAFIMSHMVAALEVPQLPVKFLQAGPYAPELEKARATLLQWLHQQDWQEAVQAGAALWEAMETGDSSAWLELAALVEARIESGLVENGAYSQALILYRRFRAGQPSPAGLDQAALRVADEGFDDTLFELWLLGEIDRSLREKFGLVRTGAKPLFVAEKRPVFSYQSGPICLTVDYHGFAPAMDDSRTPRWHFFKDATTGDRETLRGYPDIVIRADGYAPVLLDAKNMPYNGENLSKELYKMIGYMDHFRAFLEGAGGRLGGLLFRGGDLCATGPARTYLADPGEMLLTYAVEPVPVDVAGAGRPDRDAIDHLCHQILDRFGNYASALRLAAAVGTATSQLGAPQVTAGDEEAESAAAIQFMTVIGAVVDAQMEQVDLSAEETRLEQDFFGARWGQLPEQSRRLLAMAEYLFRQRTRVGTGDLAGVAVQYCRALEVATKHLFTEPMRTYLIGNPGQGTTLAGYNALTQQKGFCQNPSDPNKYLELGKVGHWLARAQDQPIATVMQAFATAVNCNIPLLTRVGSGLKQFASEYRNKVCHTGAIDESLVKRLREAVLGVGRERLLFSLVEGFHP